MFQGEVFGKYGANTGSVGVNAAVDSAVTTGGSAAGTHGVHDPMMWLFGIGAVTLGLVAFSTSVRIGKVSASVAAG